MSATAEVRERPILFSGPMVRAILDGTKTQTRRVMKPQPEPNGTWDRTLGNGGDFRCLNDYYPPSATLWNGGWLGGDAGELESCPFGSVGDRLWVRETFFDHGGDLSEMKLDERVEYRAEPWDRLCEDHEAGPWTPSIFMPRWASRLTLEITDVRVERVQEISEADAKAEGVEPTTVMTTRHGLRHRPAYRILWDSLNAKRGYGWDVNPWCWVLSFRRIEG